mmetsp:Transcript_15571/g.21509  ORF Transcript_15571/g.21509 Transcript_15571/m.21509 type:complete len:794 (-) Transcript_15571:113-2494(-)|eukprot:CAMPEP_0196584506 /NCGR_PEP_ID=MMETSP1081-20130531/47309_1 /TAXON_ID=36882 /ORGANISM="Pyramimonas amylifera, Strain CCMP720" /LENGTH=793 /DNA_ID=CAMNT_0041905733 /DNA_START=205 /DNA_END=2586 /DNA_ORIENTATION=+
MFSTTFTKTSVVSSPDTVARNQRICFIEKNKNVISRKIKKVVSVVLCEKVVGRSVHVGLQCRASSSSSSGGSQAPEGEESFDYRDSNVRTTTGAAAAAIVEEGGEGNVSKPALPLANKRLGPLARLRNFRRRLRKKNDPFEVLRGEYDLPKLQQFFNKRPAMVSRRFSRIVLVALQVWRVWRRQESWDPARRTRAQVLCKALASLGPVFIKCGQTMSERPDVVGEEAAAGMKSLQSQASPFPNIQAYQILQEDLCWGGALAPDLEGVPCRDYPRTDRPLFKSFGPEPVASASLGQVYKAETWEGKWVAVKIQRPAMLRQVALDMYSLRMSLKILKSAVGFRSDTTLIADEIGINIFKELDYHLEAENAAEFERLHAFLGFVKTPKAIYEYMGPKGTARVLTMEWIDGKKIRDLTKEQQVEMVGKAVEAAVAQLIRTGCVHADPHEGNLLFTESGDLVFLDFGLMCQVEMKVMEAFATGITNLLQGDWIGLAEVFREVGIAPPNGFMKWSEEVRDFAPCSVEEYAEGVRLGITSQAGGMTRFGALATGLGGASAEFQFLCPPFIVLLCRTFLTLEGIASIVDPDFSIYTASLPYAVRRALSPQTTQGSQKLRRALLTKTGEFRWNRLNEVLEMSTKLAQSDTSTKTVASKNGEWDTVSGLLGSPEGATLRRVSYDACSVSLAEHLASPNARTLRKKSVQTIADFFSAWKYGQEKAAPNAEGLPRFAKEQQRQQVATRVIIREHFRRLITNGPRGWFALLGLVWVGIKIGVAALFRVIHMFVANASLKLVYGTYF